MPRLASYLLLLTLFILPAQAQSVAGDWTGAIHVPGNELAIEVTLREEAGQWQGSISIPVQNLHDFALAGVRVVGDSVFFQMEGIPGTPRFRGVRSEDGNRVAGDFFQGPAHLTFALTRVETAREAARTSTADALAGFDSLVVAAMEEWKVPGMGLAIVRGDEVIYEHGFGLRNVATNAPVTPDTRFAIGSATKAFTALVLATLSDEGKLDWDEPIVEYLPDFRLHDPVATQGMTALDLVTHRSGLPRHDLLWYATPFSREELYQRLRYLEPSRPFRGAWQYQNLMFMTAGYLAGRLAGTSWEALVQQRIFTPLGMTGASLDMQTMQAAEDHATGYGGGRDSMNALPPFTLDAVGPAGSINASVRDMERWVKLQLSDGEVDGQRVLAKASLDFLHTPQVFVAARGQTASPYLLYAPGWFVEVYQGHRLLYHGGNIDGFSALVGFLPDDDLGLVMLTNKNGTPLPDGLMRTAFDRLLGLERTDWMAQMRPPASADSLNQASKAAQEAERVQGTQPAHPLADYAGDYVHPAYGTLTIQTTGDGLRAIYYHLTTPLTHWHYETFEMAETVAEGTKLTFQTDASGLVSGVAMRIEPILEPVVFARKVPEVAAGRLAQYAGQYRLNTITLTVAVRGNGITLTVPGQPTYTLVPAMQADTFQLEELAGYRARFEFEGDRVARIVLIQPNGTFRAERVE